MGFSGLWGRQDWIIGKRPTKSIAQIKRTPPEGRVKAAKQQENVVRLQRKFSVQLP
jgi:hypothetical protein